MRLRGLLAAGAASVAVFASISAVQGQPSKPNFNQACKAKYPGVRILDGNALDNMRSRS